MTSRERASTSATLRRALALLVLGSAVPGCESAVAPDDSITVDIADTASGASIGSVLVEQTAGGARFTPNLTGLTSGEHGFHMHVNPSCGSAGQDAGGHYDPLNTGSHEGPNGNGHLGDLPTLSVNSSGAATTPVVAPRVSVSDLDGRSLMIHAGGDNYSDTPAPLGGGGARVACGVVPAM
ncbi:MAG: superoxide dismutase [Cu-Zn] SodC [Gammaproteobacteria bacterium]|nr:superoxide dismutase [Cu-Zn] SodC [Gammaproteobacteria bacterium]